MKIVFVKGKCGSIYRSRSIINLRYIMRGKHEIEIIQPSKNMYKKLQEMNPQILFMIGGGREHGEIIQLFKDTGVITVSDVLKGVDVFIEDEPEVVLPLLAEAMEQGKDFSEVPGITYQHKTKPAKKWNVNSVKPIMENSGFLTFSTRGCKGKCSFCIEGKLLGSLRYRNIRDVIDEICGFPQLPEFKNDFAFADCSFDSNTPERMKKILKAVIRETPGFTYDANFRPDFHKMADKELMELLFKSGNSRSFIGIESANAADLELYGKGATVEDAEKTLSLFRSIDSCVEIGFINFSPISTFESLRENVEFLRKHHFGTYEILKKKLDLFDTPIKQKLMDEGLLWGGQYYDFRDKRVKVLAMMLNDIEKKLNKKATELYSDFSLREVKRSKKYAALHNDDESFAIVTKYEPLIEAVVNNESDRMCEWFSNLLDMVEQIKAPYADIIAMSNKYINDEHMKLAIKYFKGLEKDMHRELNQLFSSRE